MKKLLVVFLLVSTFCQAQNKPVVRSVAKADSLIRLINSKKLVPVDSTYRDITNAAIDVLETMPEKAKQLALYADSLAVKNNFREGSASANSILGIYYKNSGDYTKAIHHYRLTLQVDSALNDTAGIAKAYMNIGVVCYMKGEYEQTIKYFVKSAKKFDLLNNPSFSATIYNNTAAVYTQLQQFDKSLEYNRKSLALRTSLKDTLDIAQSMDNIGIVFRNMKQLDSAEFYLMRALDLRQAMGVDMQIANSYNNIGNLYYSKMNYYKAISYYKKAEEIRIKLNDRAGLGSVYGNIAACYGHLGQFAKCIEANKSALVIAKEVGALQTQKNIYLNMHQIYFEMGKYKDAYLTYDKYNDLNDSLINASTSQTIAQLEAQYQNEKKELEIENLNKEKELQATEIEKQQAEVKRQNMQKIAFAGGFGLMLILAFVVFRSYRQKRKDNEVISHQKAIVEEKNKEILDSISYAKRIQSAILPPDKLVKEYLPDSFILYKPKDIVAGDFYWMEHKDNKILFAAADCTGHGVPGAMVSVVCNNGLNRSVREYGITEPGKILDKTRDIVIQEFEKSEEEVKDGMDIALCTLEGNTLQYAGANNSLVIIRKGTTDLEGVEEIKANKQPIGKYAEPNPFTTHTIELNEGDSFYIFSDGFPDQFGGPKGKKFMYKPFRRLLLENVNKPMAEQRSILEHKFEEWRGALEQIDDVCIIGVRV